MGFTEGITGGRQDDEELRAIAQYMLGTFEGMGSRRMLSTDYWIDYLAPVEHIDPISVWQAITRMRTGTEQYLGVGVGPDRMRPSAEQLQQSFEPAVMNLMPFLLYEIKRVSEDDPSHERSYKVTQAIVAYKRRNSWDNAAKLIHECEYDELLTGNWHWVCDNITRAVHFCEHAKGMHNGR